MLKLRIKSIEIIRFFAILVVIVTHYWSLFMPEMFDLVYVKWETIFVGISGKLGVCMFCVLLGYFVADNCDKKDFDLVEYVVKRYLKFVIPLCIMDVSVFCGIRLCKAFGKTVIFLDKNINIKMLLRDIFFMGDFIVPTYWCIKEFFIASVLIAFCVLYGERKWKNSFLCLGLVGLICFISGKVWYLNCIFGGEFIF